MTVGELMTVLRSVDRGCMVYVPDRAGRAELAAAAVTLCHTNIPAEMKIRIPDDIMLLPASMIDEEPAA